jgi:hypothetical protein
MPRGQMLKPGAALKKARLVSLATSTFEWKVLFVESLDMIVHRVLVNFPNVAMRTDVEARLVALVLAYRNRESIGHCRKYRIGCEGGRGHEAVNFFTGLLR